VKLLILLVNTDVGTYVWTLQYLSSLNNSICGLIIDMLVLHGVIASPLDAGDYHDLGTYVGVKERSEITSTDWNLHDSVSLSSYIAIR